MNNQSRRITMLMLLLVFTAGKGFAGGINFGPIQAVNNKIDEYNAKKKEAGIAKGVWRGGKGVVAGTVSNSLGEKPYFATIYIKGNYAAGVNNSGNFSISGLEEGVQYTLRADVYDNYQSKTISIEKTITVPQGGTSVDMVFPAIVGTVRNAMGSPVYANIYLDGKETNSIYTDYYNGTYKIPYVSTGTHTLKVKGLSPARTTETTVTVQSGITTQRDMTLDWFLLDTALSTNNSANCCRMTKENSPYTVSSNFSVTDLLIDPGVEIRFSGSYSFYVHGNVIINGTALLPVKFTSGRPSPTSGDYGTVTFSSAALNYVTFEYGSGISINGSTGSIVSNCTFKNNNSSSVSLYTNGLVRNCNFERNSGNDLYLYGAPHISSCNISGSVYISNTADQCSIDNCNFTKGSGTIISNSANWTHDLKNNWWGTTTPATIAGYISNASGGCTYNPFLSATNTAAGPQ